MIFIRSFLIRAKALMIKLLNLLFNVQVRFNKLAFLILDYINAYICAQKRLVELRIEPVFIKMNIEKLKYCLVIFPIFKIRLIFSTKLISFCHLALVAIKELSNIKILTLWILTTNLIHDLKRIHYKRKLQFHIIHILSESLRANLRNDSHLEITSFRIYKRIIIKCINPQVDHICLLVITSCISVAES